MKYYKLNLLTLLSLALFLFSSCEKTELIPSGENASTTPSNSVVNALLNSHQKIIFHIGELNENSRMEKGWFITNEGDIHTYQIDADKAWSPELNSLTFLDLELLNKSIVEKISTVAVMDMLPYYEKIESAAQYSTLEESTNQYDSEKPRVAYIAYQANLDAGAGCSARNYHESDYFNQIILSIEAEAVKTNPEEAAGEILLWLKEIEQELNF